MIIAVVVIKKLVLVIVNTTKWYQWLAKFFNSKFMWCSHLSNDSQLTLLLPGKPTDKSFTEIVALVQDYQQPHPFSISASTPELKSLKNQSVSS